MSELRSAVGALQSEILAELPDARIEEDFAELQRTVELLDLERLRRLAEIERRGLHERDGHLSAASWLASRFKVAWGTARENARVARALEDMPVTRRALEEGELSMSAVRVLAAAHETDPEAFRRSEAQLVEAARIHSAGDLQRVAAFWRQAVEKERALDGEEKLRARRRLHASVTFLGMVRLDGDLDPESGETLLTALGAVLDAESRSRGEEDDRTPTQRRADALAEICRQWLDLADRPNVSGERPHVTVTVPVDAFSGGPSELDHTGPAPSETARRLACDSSVMRVVMSGRSEPLDVGRRTPVVPPSMRRAVIVRDRHCRFPGCDRPQAWRDAHPGLRRSLQHLLDDERSARGRVMEGESRGTSPCTGEGGQLGEDEGPASRDDPAGGVGGDAARHRQGVVRVAPVGELGALPDGRRLPRRGLAHLGCTSVARGPDRDRPGVPARGLAAFDRAPDRSEPLDGLP